MALTTQNAGKYLTRRWHANRLKAIEDRTQFSADELTWLEIGPDDGWGNFDSDNFEVQTVPVDPLTTSKTYDYRTRPECGDDDMVDESGAGQPGKGGYVAPPLCEITYPDTTYCG